MTANAAVPIIGTMQPTTTTTSALRPRRLLGTAVLVGALLLAGCGSDGDDDAGADTTETTAATDTGSDTGTGTGTGSDDGTTDTTAVDDGMADVDVCEAIGAEDVQAILTEADPITAVTNEVIPTPTCDYQIAIGDDTFAMDAAVITIQLASEDPAYYTAQRDLQEDSFDDVTDVEGISEGFSYNNSGTILLTTDSGVWTVIRGVEVNKEATAQATAEEMAAIAALVEERL
jgi:hypothetical protein